MTDPSSTSSPPPSHAQTRTAERKARIDALMARVRCPFIPRRVFIDEREIAYLPGDVPHPPAAPVLRKIVELWVDKGEGPILSSELVLPLYGKLKVRR